MHLMKFIEIAKPIPFERFLIILAQGIFVFIFDPLELVRLILNVSINIASIFKQI